MAAFLAIDPAWLTHPKVQAVHRDARALWIAAGLHAVAAETDGYIQKHMLPLIAGQAGVAAKRATELVDVGLWIEHRDCYEIHDFLKYNQSKALREAQREKWRNAKAKAAGLSYSTSGSTVESPAESTGESTQDSKVIPRASLPCLALPTEKALLASTENPPRNGNGQTKPPNPPTDEGRAELATVRAILAERGYVPTEEPVPE